ncbi:MAG: poly(ADP-ribose) glycohydrolase domain-containing protein [Candidatus Rifleibacteriota bacterium]
MVGRKICSDVEAVERGFAGCEAAQRRLILRETIEAFEKASPPDKFHRLAWQNLERWQKERKARAERCKTMVLAGDWGEVTASLTREYGTCFAVLNMANAWVPGGAYVEGAIAQEENMFRRTDCHFNIDEKEYDAELDRYRPEMTRLISAAEGVVFLDKLAPRVCIRGPEDRTRTDLGYAWLRDEEVFPFFELRAAAQDLRGGVKFDPEEARKRIIAQLETLRQNQIKHAVLSAFGCGAFRNPADQVAVIYREEIASRQADFSIIAFAIFSAGYGPDNFTPFAAAFEQLID